MRVRHLDHVIERLRKHAKVLGLMAELSQTELQRVDETADLVCLVCEHRCLQERMQKR